MLTFRSLISALRQLNLPDAAPVIAHASLSAFGEVQGGAETLLGALLTGFHAWMMPAFTYKTMLVPETGPAHNAMRYGSGKDANRMAEFYHPDLPVDKLIGAVPEALRLHPKTRRSTHPILSFAGVNVDAALNAQSLSEPLAPLGVLADHAGWVLLLGVDHTVNTSIHFAERLAGRRQFTRWALTPQGVAECPGFPGCSSGFSALEPRLQPFTRVVQAGSAHICAVPLDALIRAVRTALAEDPLALLCEQADCERCQELRLPHAN
jgi:aminoglycoside 3-N-acetyltransferase